MKAEAGVNATALAAGPRRDPIADGLDGRIEMPMAVLFAAWIVSLVATLGALFVGEVMGQAPCVLCWFQRAFMFPLAVILAIACWRGDTTVVLYALPLSLIGGGIAALHAGQYLGVFPEALQPCGAGPSCTSASMTILGGIPLPILSVTGFVLIGALLGLLQWRRWK